MSNKKPQATVTSDFKPGLVRKVVTPLETQEEIRFGGKSVSLDSDLLNLLGGKDLFKRKKNLARGFALHHVKEGIIDLLQLKH